MFNNKLSTLGIEVGLLFLSHGAIITFLMPIIFLGNEALQKLNQAKCTSCCTSLSEVSQSHGHAGVLLITSFTSAPDFSLPRVK